MNLIFGLITLFEIYKLNSTTVNNTKKIQQYQILTVFLVKPHYIVPSKKKRKKNIFSMYIE